MSVIMVVIDGALSSDYSVCENINKIKLAGMINNTPKGMETNSLTCIMNLLKMPKEKIPTGRAYLEAIAIGEKIEESDLILRCNNIKIEKGRLISCNEIMSNVMEDKNYKLIDMGSYKNLLIVKDGRKFYKSLKTFPPHQNIGKRIEDIIPSSGNIEFTNFLKDLIYKYNLYPWGESIKENFPSFYNLHNINGAMICKTEIVKGIGKAMNMYTPDLLGTTADIDTDLEIKAKTALNLSLKYDFVLLHINGVDESAHRRNINEKLDFMRKIDCEVIGLLMKELDKDSSLIITSDHGTSEESGAHVNTFVNFYIYNDNIEKTEKWINTY
ncbi:alkaline phosphatase family protein [Clostridium sp. SHJSY1]|uniref:alkaline phosphatase family protein n=1 Tax=Clostridium sp. SHJSY1 TaxID=2942483 RepID=UPI002876A7FD|nr:alkaline phosphatase family protein [Clostridium sp. SHJSY1]MDS0528204.1 alkaline phosphatase family protein [Clostridium sp. SHJSY1]